MSEAKKTQGEASAESLAEMSEVDVSRGIHPNRGAIIFGMARRSTVALVALAVGTSVLLVLALSYAAGWVCTRGGLALYQTQPGQANSLLRMGCALGNVEACYRRAFLLQEGRGVSRDLGGAVELFQRACDDGVADACNDGGWLLDKIPAWRDPKRTFSLYQRACDMGSSMGCVSLALQYERGEVVPKALSIANDMLDKECIKGNPRACTNLGMNHQHGKGVPKDDARARLLHARACQGNDPFGCSNLAFLLDNGRGGPEDPKEALRLNRFACGHDERHACSNLGYMLVDGRGTAVDKVNGRIMLEKGCALRDGWGCARLAKLDEESGARSLALARYLTACELDAASACVSAGAAYAEDGSANDHGVRRDVARARLLFEKACKAGFQGGCEKLATLQQ